MCVYKIKYTRDRCAICMQVMLLGHSDEYTADKIMKVTVAFNRFASGLVERMPRYIYIYICVT